jgi:hypothetical protein
MENQLSSACNLPELSTEQCMTNYAPTTMRSKNKMRQISIEEMDRGFIVRVGCQTFAISTKSELTTKLLEYINDPDQTEKRWNDGKLF